MFLKSTGVKMVLSKGKSAHSRMAEALLGEELRKIMKLRVYQKMFPEKTFQTPCFLIGRSAI